MLRTIITALALAFISTTAMAEKDPIYTGLFSNVAVQGHDPVAYFTTGAPTKGSSEYATSYQGATFKFSSQENLEAFLANPSAYAPQYGGYCAWAVSQNYTAKGDARYWKIVDGKLYLNYDAQVQAEWETDISGFISAADANWPGVLQND